MSDTTETETDTNTDNTDNNTDEPTKAELHDRVQQLESTVEKLMPSRRDALKSGKCGRNDLFRKCIIWLVYNQ